MKKHYLITVIFIFLFLKIMLAQSVLTDFTQLGPYDVTQRSTALHIDDTNPNRWYLGTEGGGLWVSNDAGTNWEKLDPTNNLGSKIVDIEQDTDNPNNIYYLSAGFFFPNHGIYHSTDGGATFSALVLSNQNIQNFDAFEIEIVNSKLFLQTSTAIYKVSSNGTLTELLNSSDINNETIYRMKVLKENNTSEHIMVSTETKIYRGNDTGSSSFNVVLNSLTADWCDIGYSRNNPNIIYALIADDGKAQQLYKSTTYGALNSWQLVYDKVGSQPFSNQGELYWIYDDFNGVWVDPDKPDTLILSSTDSYLSIDGGLNWHLCMSSTASIEFGDFWPHSFQRNPINGKLILGHDHGLYEGGEEDLFDYTDSEYPPALVEGAFINKAKGVSAFTAYVGSYFGTNDDIVIAGQDRGAWVIYENNTEKYVGGGDVLNLLISDNRVHTFNKHGSDLLENYDYQGNFISSIPFSNELDSYATKNQSAITKQNEIFYVNDVANSNSQFIVFKSTNFGNTLVPIYISNTIITSLVTYPVSGNTYILEGQDLKKIVSGTNVVTELMTSTETLFEIELFETNENFLYGWNENNVYKFDLANNTQTNIISHPPKILSKIG